MSRKQAVTSWNGRKEAALPQKPENSRKAAQKMTIIKDKEKNRKGYQAQEGLETSKNTTAEKAGKPQKSRKIQAKPKSFFSGRRDQEMQKRIPNAEKLSKTGNIKNSRKDDKQQKRFSQAEKIEKSKNGFHKQKMF